MLTHSQICSVCGDTPAKVHYGVFACFGCKGFFRRAVKHGRNKYVCRFEKNCEVTKYERNSCRYCRFRKCLLVGMNPDFIRPDREDSKNEKTALGKKKSLCKTTSRAVDGDWTMALSVVHRKFLLELNKIENECQECTTSSFDNVAYFSLKSLLADRLLARKTRFSPSSSSNLKRADSEKILCIEQVVKAIDFADQFLLILERENAKKISSEDKSSLMSNVVLQLIALDTTARYSAKCSTNYEDFKQLLQPFSLDQMVYAKMADICELFKQKAPSPIEYSILKAYAITITERTVLSNELNKMLSAARDMISEILFKVVKIHRQKPSSIATCTSNNLLHIVYEVKELSGHLRRGLQLYYPRDNNQMSSQPFQKIFTDLLNPEVSDLLITMSKYSTPTIPCPEQPMFQFPQYQQPQNSDFNFPKLPLTLTKSLEEILKPPGMLEDHSILNHPLDRNWADGFKLTPVFSRDIVSQFFPELSATQL